MKPNFDLQISKHRQRVPPDPFQGPSASPARCPWLRIAVILLVGGLGILQSFASTVYIWKDENGVTHVTNQTPPESIQEVKRFEYEPAGRETSGTISEDPGQEKPDKQKQKLEERVQVLKEQVAEALDNAKESRKIAAEKRAAAEKLQNSFFANKTYVERGRLQSDIKRLLDESAEAAKRAREYQNKAEITDRRIKMIESEIKKKN